MSAWPSADNRPTATMPADSSSDAARLRELGYEPALARRLSVRDLVIHGLIYMVPLAPIGVFGIIYDMSAGAVAAVYVVAAFAMWFSAISYNEMAQCFPVSGSTYSRHPLREAAPQSQVVRPCGLPMLGAAILLVALGDADTNTKIVGICWLIVGLGVVAYSAWRDGHWTGPKCEQRCAMPLVGQALRDPARATTLLRSGLICGNGAAG